MNKHILREVALDTETTGLDVQSGHRIIEIGCIELKNRIITGKYFHTYVNPKRDIPYQATRIHGLTEEKLSNQPVFSEIAEGFLNFIGDDTLIIHNAEFDIKFINMELLRQGLKPLDFIRVVDTLTISRKKFSGSPASLDALCKRFNISLKDRKLHGAKIDAELLAKVYIELMGGLQISFELVKNPNSSDEQRKKKKFIPPRKYELTEEEERLHSDFIRKIHNSLWSGINKI